MKHILIRFIPLFIFFLFFSLSPAASRSAYASDATIGVSPQTGSAHVGQLFNVDLKITSNGKSFAGVKGTVTVSNFSIKQLIVGDCAMSFIQTPQVNDPSFTGVILGDSSTGCTLYTLQLLPITTGYASITITNPELKEYKTANSMSVLLANGGYAVTQTSSSQGNTPTPTVTPTPPSSPQDDSLYNITIQTFDFNNTPVSGAEVSLASGQKGVTDSQGNVSFPNIEKGVYNITVTYQTKKFASTILNASGTNHQIVLGISEQKQKMSIWTWILIGVGIVAFIVLALFLIKKYIIERNN